MCGLELHVPGFHKCCFAANRDELAFKSFCEACGAAIFAVTCDMKGTRSTDHVAWIRCASEL